MREYTTLTGSLKIGYKAYIPRTALAAISIAENREKPVTIAISKGEQHAQESQAG
jgi:hypothetical protein